MDWASLGWVLVGLMVFTAAVAVVGAARLVARAKVFVSIDIDRTQPPRTDIDQLADDLDDDDDDGEQESGAGDKAEAAGADGGSDDDPPCPVAVGNCRACSAPHIGLVPVSVVLGPKAGMFKIPAGTPFVCPRCWAKCNEGMLTNIVPVPTAKPDPAAPVPAPVLTPDQKAEIKAGMAANDATLGEELDRLDREDAAAPIVLDAVIQDVKAVDPKPKEASFGPAEEVPACWQCGKPTKGGRTDRDGRPWCQGCIDALGGPIPFGRGPRRKK